MKIMKKIVLVLGVAVLVLACGLFAFSAKATEVDSLTSGCDVADVTAEVTMVEDKCFQIVVTNEAEQNIGIVVKAAYAKDGDDWKQLAQPEKVLLNKWGVPCQEIVDLYDTEGVDNQLTITYSPWDYYSMKDVGEYRLELQVTGADNAELGVIWMEWNQE